MVEKEEERGTEGEQKPRATEEENGSGGARDIDAPARCSRVRLLWRPQSRLAWAVGNTADVEAPRQVSGEPRGRSKDRKARAADALRAALPRREARLSARRRGDTGFHRATTMRRYRAWRGGTKANSIEREDRGRAAVKEREANKGVLTKTAGAVLRPRISGLSTASDVTCTYVSREEMRMTDARIDRGDTRVEQKWRVWPLDPPLDARARLGSSCYIAIRDKRDLARVCGHLSSAIFASPAAPQIISRSGRWSSNQTELRNVGI